MVQYFLTSWWQDFWQFHFDKTVINFVETPQLGSLYFTIPLYAFLLLLFIIFINVLRPISKYVIIKAFIISCMIIGILFALRMDYTWFKTWQSDQYHLSSRSVYERQGIIMGIGPVISSFLKETGHPPSAVRIYSNDHFFKEALTYYLLPVEVSDRGARVVVYDQDDIMFNQTNNTLTQKGHVIMENVLFVGKLPTKQGVVYFYQAKGSGE